MDVPTKLKCQAKTAKGLACKSKACKNERFCHVHGGTPKTPTETKTLRTLVPKVKLSKSLRDPKPLVLKSGPPKSAVVKKGSPKKAKTPKKGTRLSPDLERGTELTSLGWSPTKAIRYAMDYKDLPMHIDEQKDPIPFPPEFEKVKDRLMKICNTVEGTCIYHYTMPGVQWTAHKSVCRDRNEEFKLMMRKRGNHFFHGLTFEENKAYPDYDKFYCMCHETNAEKQAYRTLLLSETPDENPAFWQEIHGNIYTEDYEKYGDERKVTEELKAKIVKDAVEYSGQEYKIHLQPKPEYQIPVLKLLVNLLNTNPEIRTRVEAFKTIIPYNRVTTDLELPVIVIYPVWGAENAKIVLDAILDLFSTYDVKTIGLNHTPRFNAKINELVFYANGSGDHKRFLPDKFFSDKTKIFYKGSKKLH